MAKRKKSTAWTRFVRKHRKKGLSMKAVARLWKKSKRHTGRGKGRRHSLRLRGGHGLTPRQRKRLLKFYAQLKKAKRSGNRSKAKSAAKKILALKKSVAEHYTSGARGYAEHMKPQGWAAVAHAAQQAEESSLHDKYGDPGGRRRKGRKKGKRKGHKKGSAKFMKAAAQWRRFQKALKKHLKGRSITKVQRRALWRKFKANGGKLVGVKSKKRSSSKRGRKSGYRKKSRKSTHRRGKRYGKRRSSKRHGRRRPR